LEEAAAAVGSSRGHKIGAVFVKTRDGVSLTLARVKLIEAPTVPASLARVHEPTAAPVRVGLVQHAWVDDPDSLRRTLSGGIRAAADAGAQIVFLPELTLSRYPADTMPDGPPSELAEPLDGGPTVTFAGAAAREHGVHVHASLYERADGGDGLGFNTAIIASPDGELVARTRKTHIPVTAGYYEDRYFRPGPADDAYPVVELTDPSLRLGLPTCWDEWFPEVARIYSLAGAEVLCYPTAIGSEPDHPDFDTQPLWQQVIIGNGIANGLFMVVPNRYGTEGMITFYGSSFISDPYGRVLVQAPRDEAAVLVADLDLAQRQDWLDLFPFLATRRPDSYGDLVDPIRPEHRRHIDPAAR
jgi:N-carbamoylputrescine amidase